MATITLRNQDGHEETFECDEDTYILDALEEEGLDHPSSCKAGDRRCRDGVLIRGR